MDYVTFNLWEALFWVVLGVVSFVLLNFTSQEFKKLEIFSGCVLVLFGVSDFVESQVGSFFEQGLGWLFIWKVLGVIGLTYSIIWYLWIRLR